MDSLNDPENDLSLIKDRLESFEGLDQEVQEQIEAVNHKYERWTQLIKEHKRLEKGKKTVKKESDQVQEVMMKGKSSLKTCVEKTKEMEEKNSFKAKALEREKMRLDSAPDVWQLLGLNLTILDTPTDTDAENDFSNGTNCSNGTKNGHVETDDLVDGKRKIIDRNVSFHFSKIDPCDENRLFIVKTSISARFLKDKNSSCFKIYESDPGDLFSSPQIDMIESQAGTDSRLFIILLRKHIESKVAKKPSTREKIPQSTREKDLQSTREKIPQPTREKDLQSTREKIPQPTREKIPQPTREEKTSQKSGQPKSSQPPKESGAKIPPSKIPLAR